MIIIAWQRKCHGENKNCLQTQKNASDYAEMDARITQSLAQHNLTYLELLRKLAVDCDQFILFVRDKSFESDMTQWPEKYRHKIDYNSNNILRLDAVQYSARPLSSPPWGPASPPARPSPWRPPPPGCRRQGSPWRLCRILVLVHRAAGEPSGLLVLLLEEHDLVQHVDHVDHRVGDPNDHVVLVIRN